MSKTTQHPMRRIPAQNCATLWAAVAAALTGAIVWIAQRVEEVE